ncbi:MAG: N-substituted formamide deformylase [Hyphomonas sp. TMED17]|nr:MAG: N-substituted formamide deformylase [Hyphomonas sp. TMED17]
MRWLVLPLLCLGLLGCRENEPVEQTQSGAVIYAGADILTMAGNDVRPEAVVVRDGRIAGVGALEVLVAANPDAIVDNTFAGKTLLPGLIDPHMHVLLGAMMYGQAFAPPWPMAMPGDAMAGYQGRDAFLARVAEIVADAPPDGSPIIVYGYHNLVQGNLDRRDLDRIVSDRPLLVWHYSGHDFYLNSAALTAIGATPETLESFHGVGYLVDGSLNGRIYEDAAFLVVDKMSDALFGQEVLQRGIDKYFEIMRQSGITTAADLGYGIFGRALENQIISMVWAPERTGFNLYLVPEYRAMRREFGDDAPQAILELVSGERPAPARVLPSVKFFTDAAYYSQTMRLSPPGYLAGQSEGTSGLWVTEPDALVPTLQPIVDAGLGIHIHSNGDAAQAATLAALANLRATGFTGKFVIEHGGLFSPEQAVLAGRLNAMVSVASHYVHYMSTIYAEPLGHTRADWITPVGSLSRAGSIIALHSDAPLAPPDPLRAGSVHMTRETREGGIYVASEALTPQQALEAVTINAAYILGLEQEIGTIEAGKRADFTILEANPLELAAQDWPAIGVWGVVLNGRKAPLQISD